jgi:hypothetical protein
MSQITSLDGDLSRGCKAIAVYIGFSERDCFEKRLRSSYIPWVASKTEYYGVPAGPAISDEPSAAMEAPYTHDGSARADVGAPAGSASAARSSTVAQTAHGQAMTAPCKTARVVDGLARPWPASRRRPHPMHLPRNARQSEQSPLSIRHDVGASDDPH